MKRFFIAAALALLAVGPSLAQEAPAPSQVEAAVSEEKLALVRRFFDVGRVARTTEDAMRAMIPIAAEQAMQQHPSLTTEHRQALVESMIESVKPTAARILDRFAPIYAQAFTTEELTTIIAFYETPAAQALLDKQPQLMATTTQITRELIPEFEAEMLRRFCGKVDCFSTVPEWAPEANAS
ncbi:MAG TPA: DUF2059 domain-containing protein [Caulobacteraceae bacterium]|nr:DUF2059 domain-containing protein [Caulobacteraceae bacterium]